MESEFEAPLVERERLLAALKRLVGPLLGDLRGSLRACGQLHLTVRYSNSHIEEHTRAFILPTAGEAAIVGALEQLVDKMSWPAPVIALNCALEQIQEAVIEQLTLFPGENERERKLREVQRYLAARFGANCLRRAALVQPGAPLSEWRVGWNEAAIREAGEPLTRLAVPGRGQYRYGGTDDAPAGFSWRGTSHHIENVCNRWQVHTRWWEPGETCGASTGR